MIIRSFMLRAPTKINLIIQILLWSCTYPILFTMNTPPLLFAINSVSKTTYDPMGSHLPLIILPSCVNHQVNRSTKTFSYYIKSISHWKSASQGKPTKAFVRVRFRLASIEISPCELRWTAVVRQDTVQAERRIAPPPPFFPPLSMRKKAECLEK